MSFIKKITKNTFRRGSRRRASEPLREQPRQPSPTLEHLTPEELEILNNVIHKQEKFEQEETSRIMKMKRDLQVLEERVKQASASKSKLKQVDLRLCRLCFKTKFADGIGRACYDCHRRVCNRCGTFSKARWDATKNKLSRGKWRCNICHKQREVLMATGMWYHGDDAQPAFNSRVFQRKVSSSALDTDSAHGGDYEQSDYDQSSISNTARPGELTDVESDQTYYASTTGQETDDTRRCLMRLPRKSLLPSEEFSDLLDEEESVIDDDAFQQERRKSWQERIKIQKKQGRRRCRRMSVGTSTQEDGIITEEVPSMLDSDCPMHDRILTPSSASQHRRVVFEEGHIQVEADIHGTTNSEMPESRNSAREGPVNQRLRRRTTHDQSPSRALQQRDIVVRKEDAIKHENLPRRQTMHESLLRRSSNNKNSPTHSNNVTSIYEPGVRPSVPGHNTHQYTPYVTPSVAGVPRSRQASPARHIILRSGSVRVQQANAIPDGMRTENVRRSSVPHDHRKSLPRHTRLQKQHSVAADLAYVSKDTRIVQGHPVASAGKVPVISISRASLKQRGYSVPSGQAANVDICPEQSTANLDSHIEYSRDKKSSDKNRRPTPTLQSFDEHNPSSTDSHRGNPLEGVSPISLTTSEKDFEGPFSFIHDSQEYLFGRQSSHSLSSNLSLCSNIMPSKMSLASNHTLSTRGTSIGSLSAGGSTGDRSTYHRHHATSNACSLAHSQNSDDVCYEGLASFLATPVTNEDRFKKEHTLSAQTKASFRRSSSGNQQRVCLCKNPNENNCRTNGLGMIVIGGKAGPDGKLGAYVVDVIPKGSADMTGICVGDQILEWDGSSLEDATYEETRQVIEKSGDKVQLIVMYHRTHGEQQQQKQVKKQHKTAETNDDKTAQAEETEPPAQADKKAKSPIIAKGQYGKRHNSFSGVLPSDIWNPKPLKRTLPKTPEEMKRLQARLVQGRIQLRLWHDRHASTLAVHVIRAHDIHGQEGSNKTGIKVKSKTFVRVRVLPHDRESAVVEKFTSLVPTATDMEWDKTFLYNNMVFEELNSKALEVTVWAEDRLHEMSFLGEVVFDLDQSNTDNHFAWFDLEDHDENNGELLFPQRINPDTLEPLQLASETAKDVWKSMPKQPSPVLDKMRTLTEKKLKGGVGRFNRQDSDLTGSAPDLSYPAKNSSTDFSLAVPSCHRAASDNSRRRDIKRRSCVRRIKLKVSTVVNNIGTKLVDKRSASLDSQSAINLDLRNNPRRFSEGTLKFSSKKANLKAVSKFLTPGPSLAGSRSSSKASLNSASNGPSCPTSIATSDVEDITYKMRPAPEGDDITSLLGPGQVPPKPSLEKLVKGDIKLGFMITKGQLEIDVICAKGLAVDSSKEPPDTYVKTYLVGNDKRLQKKKTKTVKGSVDPIYRQKIKYCARNVHGRFMQILIKNKLGNFERNPCFGEVIVKLDNLDLSCYTMGWYKLFKEASTRFGSTESLCLL